MSADVRTRQATAEDAAFLTEMLAEAAAWQPGANASVADVLANRSFAHYVTGWPRASDYGVVALEGSARVGAAWYRFFTSNDRSFGFVAADVPELSIAVTPSRRGQGIGRLLLTELLQASAENGCASVSLSGEPDNPARRLYEALGFRLVDTSGGAWTMLATHST